MARAVKEIPWHVAIKEFDKEIQMIVGQTNKDFLKPATLKDLSRIYYCIHRMQQLVTVLNNMFLGNHNDLADLFEKRIKEQQKEIDDLKKAIKKIGAK